MKFKVWLWLSVCVLLLTGLLTFLFRDVVRDWVALPLARILRIGNLMLGTVPQIAFWALLLLLGALMAVRSLIEHEKRSPSAERAVPVSLGRVRALLRWVQQEPESAYHRQRLAYHLVRLATEIQAFRQERTPGRFDRRLDDLNAPPEIRAYLEASMTPLSWSTPGPLSRFVRWLQPQKASSYRDTDLEDVVRFLEDQLEVYHGN
jgi:hypothetical protein